MAARASTEAAKRPTVCPLSSGRVALKETAGSHVSMKSTWMDHGSAVVR
jgi:hypothetical protein